MNPVELGDGIAACGEGDLHLSLWRDPASSARWQWLTERQHAFLASQPEGGLLFSVILSSSSPPDAKLRAEMQGSFAAMGTRLRKQIVLPAGDGMWQGVVRTIVRGVLLFSGQAKQQAVASNLDDALRLLREAASPRTPSDDTIRAMLKNVMLALDVLHQQVR